MNWCNCWTVRPIVLGRCPRRRRTAATTRWPAAAAGLLRAASGQHGEQRSERRNIVRRGGRPITESAGDCASSSCTPSWRSAQRRWSSPTSFGPCTRRPTSDGRPISMAKCGRSIGKCARPTPFSRRCRTTIWPSPTTCCRCFPRNARQESGRQVGASRKPQRPATPDRTSSRAAASLDDRCSAAATVVQLDRLNRMFFSDGGEINSQMSAHRRRRNVLCPQQQSDHCAGGGAVAAGPVRLAGHDGDQSERRKGVAARVVRRDAGISPLRARILQRHVHRSQLGRLHARRSAAGRTGRKARSAGRPARPREAFFTQVADRGRTWSTS